MVASVLVQIALIILLLLATVVALGFLVAAFVVWLAPITGLAGALAITGGGFLVLGGAIALWARVLARRARRRRRSATTLFGLAELALLLLPKSQIRRLQAGVAAGMGLAALVTLLLHPHEPSDT